MPVTCRLKGRLGNQAFIVATTIAYAIKHGIDYIIPEHTLNDAVWPPHFGYLHYPHEHSGHLISVSEKSHEYNELPFETNWAGHLIELDGYFQSELYFKDIEGEIKKLFKAPEPHTWKKRVCSIHQRFGDYIELADKHPLVTMDYLGAAMTTIILNSKTKYFHVFSDDIEKAKMNMRSILSSGRFPEVMVGYSENNSPVGDLMIMASCNENIISNSTFSWWGAWLNNTPDKIVISPHEDIWFGPGNSHLSTRDILPPNWIRIKY